MLARLVHNAFAFYELGLFAYVVCGWFLHPVAHRLRNRLARWYEPLLGPIRSHVPELRFGMAVMDPSPVLLFLGLAVLKGLLLSILVPPV
ncbi:YggT family protein [Pontiella sp.]|uniref:YggT family protein n=1 Tax=Pontiella sp. TaxID=2837462 RepID=UPI003563C379